MRPRITYANLLSTLIVAGLLVGGTALAATQLAKKSVGAKQLKANAVTTAKIKKNAVTAAKIKAGAVDGTKIKDGSVTGAEINAPSTPFSQVVARIRNASAAAYVPGDVYPLGGYTQSAGETNQWIAGLDVEFSADCTPPRTATAYLLANSANPAEPKIEELVASGRVQDSRSGAVTKRMRFGPSYEAATALTRTAPSASTPYMFSIYLGSPECKTGSGARVVGAGLDVIGTR